MDKSSQLSLLELFSKNCFYELIEQATNDGITPSTDPIQSRLVAAALLKIGKFQECIHWCDELYPALHNDTEFLNLYAAGLRASGCLEKSLSIFEQSLLIEPDNRHILNNYANLLIDLKRYKEALDILSKLVDLYPDFHEAITNHALASQAHLDSNDTDRDVPEESGPDSKPDELTLSLDPLAAAFNSEEVRISLEKHGLIESGAKSPLQPIISPDSYADYLELARKSTSDAPSQALSILDRLYQHSLHHDPEIYPIAVNAFISEKQFDRALHCALAALSLGVISPELLLNVSSLLRLKNHIKLSRHFLAVLQSRYPDYEPLNSALKHLEAHKSELTPFTT